jgi:hypothetical protein
VPEVVTEGVKVTVLAEVLKVQEPMLVPDVHETTEYKSLLKVNLIVTIEDLSSQRLT